MSAIVGLPRLELGGARYLLPSSTPTAHEYRNSRCNCVASIDRLREGARRQARSASAPTHPCAIMPHRSKTKTMRGIFFHGFFYPPAHRAR